MKLKIAGWILPIFICIFPSYLLYSQEVLTNMRTNPLLIRKYLEIKQDKKIKHPSGLDTISIATKPFLDDFSKDDIYPDASLWLDSNVFINRDLPIAPPTLGVATFDGVSKSGCPYDTTLINPNASLSADTLTSKPINLVYNQSDSLYLSFFWQAKGRGNPPEQGDSLLLDFFNPTTRVWSTIWQKKGYNPTLSDSSFHLVSIPIIDTAYLKNAFQFRFRNKATVSGNVDHWHIDYVLLDKNRKMSDTIFDDVAFVYNSRSLLKNYYAMPWEQYRPSEMKTNLHFFIRNNDTIGKNISFDYKIYNNSGGTEATYKGGSDNIFPFSTSGYCNIPSLSNPPIGTSVGSTITPYSYPILTDTASFTMECIIKPFSDDKDSLNDILRFKQNFYNYYAYDDGTVEAGYGLNVYGGQIAYKFTLNTPDTLVAVQMLFDWIPPKVSQRQFRIRIWNDAGGLPGSLIYEDSLVSPQYEYQIHDDWGNLTNMFHPYLLTSSQVLSGTFYVGLIQYCCNGNNELLNIGYDKNTNSSSKMFYNIGNDWLQTTLPTPGSWMIRPVFRNTKGLLTVNTPVDAPKFNIFPDPSNGIFTVECSRPEIRNIEVFNLLGKKIYSASVLERQSSVKVDLSDKPDGIYFLRIADYKGKVHSQKLILSK